jgi:hypothetical protein
MNHSRADDGELRSSPLLNDRRDRLKHVCESAPVTDGLSGTFPSEVARPAPDGDATSACQTGQVVFLIALWTPHHLNKKPSLRGSVGSTTNSACPV